MENKNKLFIDFLGARVTNDTYFINGMYINDKEENLKFDKDLNWIMEVVEKIVKLELYTFEFWYSGGTTHEWLCSYEVQPTIKAERYGIVTRSSKNKVEAICNATVEFLKWYNEENK